MVLLLAFIIMYFIPATDTQIMDKIPGITSPQQLEQIKALSDLTQWSILGRAARASFILAMCIEGLIEASAFLVKGLPVVWRWIFARGERSIKTVEQLKMIRDKIEMGARLTRREQRLYDKWIITKKGGSYEKLNKFISLGAITAVATVVPVAATVSCSKKHKNPITTIIDKLKGKHKTPAQEQPATTPAPAVSEAK
ncbi:hypothetical protein [Mycoplasma seminis]|uniref:Uncharacterized protein n=1 Tax=Mycoplasma seminis TaxID=512749 RepID=A0ABY9HC68_9MOLU|nr:hypothetical protein [Mycoplasma seminis]WLP85278.1 hypothetical protein Q8852_03065 [Mycoplasma seminis]